MVDPALVPNAEGVDDLDVHMVVGTNGDHINVSKKAALSSTGS